MVVPNSRDFNEGALCMTGPRGTTVPSTRSAARAAAAAATAERHSPNKGQTGCSVPVPAAHRRWTHTAEKRRERRLIFKALPCFQIFVVFLNRQVSKKCVYREVCPFTAAVRKPVCKLPTSINLNFTNSVS